MENKIFPYWLAVEESKLVHFRDLAHMMAKAIYPSDAEEMSYAVARVNLDDELPKAVQSGELIVRNPAGLGSLTLPIGETLKAAVILPQDLRPFLEQRGIELRLMPHGSGPLYWTLENAAAAIAEQEGWHNGARASLLDEVKAAADSRHLKVRDPHTDLYKTTGEVRTFWELVTPADVNAWLEKQGAPYRWNVPEQVTRGETFEETERDSAYKTKYDRAWVLYDEKDKWEQMQHQNDPLRAIEIENRLAAIDSELAELCKPDRQSIQADASKQAPASDADKPKTRNTWPDSKLKTLRQEHKEGATHEELAEKHGCKRQNISKLLAKAEAKFGRQKAGHFDAVATWGKKK